MNGLKRLALFVILVLILIAAAGVVGGQFWGSNPVGGQFWGSQVAAVGSGAS
jgi:hypothetical protein